jgi:pyridoxine 5-phosphate synthase
MTVLSVNVNKVAVLRNSRGGDAPSVTAAARAVLAAGAAGVTVHPRPDARHVRADDVAALARLVVAPAELNIEGNPFAPPRPGYPGLLALVQSARPAQVTLVPDGDGQLTSDHGFDLPREVARLAPLVAAYRAAGARVSLFVDAGVRGLAEAAAIGVARIELYTGPFAEAHAAGDAGRELAALAATAREAQSLGLAVNAGHDLSQANLGDFLAAVPNVAEVSIGHALIGEALYAGLEPTVRAYLRILAAAG